MNEVQKECYETVDRILNSPMGLVSLATMAHNISQGGQVLEREAAAIVATRFMEGVVKLTFADLKGLDWEEVIDDDEEQRRFEKAHAEMGEHSEISRLGTIEEHEAIAQELQKAMMEKIREREEE